MIIKIAILSDTHLRGCRKQFPLIVLDSIKDVDFIIHCGDILHADVLKELEKIASVYAVRGNTDKEEGLALPERLILPIGNIKIGVFHGHGTKGNTVDRAYEAFQEENVEVILFGHSHQPFLKTKNGVLMINPGSPTVKRKEKRYSFAILYVDTVLRCEFVFF
ncbi:MAG: metallophosphoesterase family protein [Thermotaleaceae bacterium]